MRLKYLQYIECQRIKKDSIRPFLLAVLVLWGTGFAFGFWLTNAILDSCFGK